MKVFLVSTFFHPVSGGVETHVYDLAKELMQKGHEVEVLCSDSTKIGPRLKEKRSVVSGIKVRRFFSWFGLSYYHKFYPGLFFYLLRNRSDVIHVHGFRKIETYMALFASKFTKARVILTTHNPFPTKTRSDKQDFLIKIHDATFGKWFTKKIHRIITLVKSEKEIFIDNFNVKPDKIITIPNALGDRFFTLGNKDQFFSDWNINMDNWDGLVVSAGRINYAKGFQNLYKAVQSMPKVLFFITGGDDGYLDKLKALYSESPNMIFSCHFMSYDKLINMYAASDIFVFPSMHEAFGMVLLEVMAQGKPIISTNVGGPSDFVKQTFGILIDPNNQDLWESNIKNLLMDKKKLKQMGDSAQKESKLYSWNKLINKLIKAYA